MTTLFNVLAADDGRPLRGVDVTVSRQVRPALGDEVMFVEAARARTDAAGRWQVDVPAGVYGVSEGTDPPNVYRVAVPDGVSVWAGVVLDGDLTEEEVSELAAHLADADPHQLSTRIAPAVDAYLAANPSADHPDLAAHDALGLATQAELDAVAASATAASEAVQANIDTHLAGHGTGGSGGVAAGTAVGQVLVWDGATYVPVAPEPVTAADVPFTPSGTAAATDVQAAIVGAYPPSAGYADGEVAVLVRSGTGFAWGRAIPSAGGAHPAGALLTTSGEPLRTTTGDYLILQGA
jgi:hypothetical protein